jgi:hypothetical protein
VTLVHLAPNFTIAFEATFLGYSNFVCAIIALFYQTFTQVGKKGTKKHCSILATSV